MRKWATKMDRLKKMVRVYILASIVKRVALQRITMTRTAVRCIDAMIVTDEVGTRGHVIRIEVVEMVHAMNPGVDVVLVRVIIDLIEVLMTVGTMATDSDRIEVVMGLGRDYTIVIGHLVQEAGPLL